MSSIRFGNSFAGPIVSRQSDCDQTYRLAAADTVGETSTTDPVSGLTTTTHTETSTGSLHETGTETGGSYVMDKSTTGYHDTTATDNPDAGMFTLDGTIGTTSTAIESNVHDVFGAYSATFTEILTDDATQSEFGEDASGNYTLTQDGTRTNRVRHSGCPLASLLKF